MTVTVVIPTRNAGSYADDMVAALSRQSVTPLQVLVMDSDSTDDTRRVFSAAGAEVLPVHPKEFDHARTRNCALSLARGDILVFLTQDAIPAREDALERLIAPLVGGEAVGAFGRHLPRPDASPLERFARSFNYPPTSRTVAPEQLERQGVRACFFSNSFSAIRRDFLCGMGGFPGGTVMNEDMLFAARALSAGRRLAYVAEAEVRHSHANGPTDVFRRYFDIGAVFADASELPVGRKAAGEGLLYVRALLAHLASERLLSWLPRAVLETGCKAAGYALGRRYRLLPVRWRQRLSAHPHYWERER